MSDFATVILSLALFISGIMVGAGAGMEHAHNTLWRDAVTRGLAEYCPADDTFAWKGECQ